MNDVLSKIDKLKTGMSMPEQEMQAEASSNLRDAKRYMNDVDAPETSFYDELKRAQTNGMDRENAEALFDSFEKAGEDISPENSHVVQSSIQEELTNANDKYENLVSDGAPSEIQDSVYDNTALKGESLYRAGIEADAASGKAAPAGKNSFVNSLQSPEKNETVERYGDSIRRSVNLSKIKNEKIADRNDPKKRLVTREQAYKEVENSLKKLESAVKKSGKQSELNIAGKKVSATPTLNSNGEKGVLFKIAGQPVKLSDLAKILVNAVPGAREAKLVYDIVKKICDAIKAEQSKHVNKVAAR